MAEPERDDEQVSGWGPDNELFHELWPMEIPPLQIEENDPVEFPSRVPTSFLTRTQGE